MNKKETSARMQRAFNDYWRRNTERLGRTGETPADFKYGRITGDETDEQLHARGAENILAYFRFASEVCRLKRERTEPLGE